MIAEVTLLRQMSLKHARSSLRLSQKKLAALAGVHFNVISDCENGKRIRLTTAYAILNALNSVRKERKLYALDLKQLTWRIVGEPEDGEG